MKLQDLFENEISEEREELWDRFTETFIWYEGGASAIPKNDEEEEFLETTWERINELQAEFKKLYDSKQDGPKVIEKMQDLVGELEEIDSDMQADFEIG